MQKRCYNCLSKITENDKVCPFCGEILDSSTPAHHLLPGTVLNGKYFIGRVIGEGGFGITYIGIDTVLEIKIAVKEYFPKGLINRNNTYDSCVISNASADDSTEYNKGLERFLSEARILAKFTGENGIVTVRDYFEENNTAYIVMEYIDGVSLSEYLSVHKRITEEETLQYMLPLMESLKKVHSENLIHRDISPENIMLANGKTVLIDFGASRVSSVVDKNGHSVYLKDGYAPLEQYSEQGNQGPWTDIYSLAATMYRCVTGKTPLNATLRYYGQKIKKPSEISKKDVFSEKFENAIVKGLSVNYKDRFQSVDDFIKALPSVEDYKATIKKTTNSNKISTSKRTQNRKTSLLAFFLVLVIIISSTVTYYFNSKGYFEARNATNKSISSDADNKTEPYELEKSDMHGAIVSALQKYRNNFGDSMTFDCDVEGNLYYIESPIELIIRLHCISSKDGSDSVVQTFDYSKYDSFIYSFSGQGFIAVGIDSEENYYSDLYEYEKKERTNLRREDPLGYYIGYAYGSTYYRSFSLDTFSDDALVEIALYSEAGTVGDILNIDEISSFFPERIFSVDGVLFESLCIKQIHHIDYVIDHKMPFDESDTVFTFCYDEKNIYYIQSGNLYVFNVDSKSVNPINTIDTYTNPIYDLNCVVNNKIYYSVYSTDADNVSYESYTFDLSTNEIEKL